tara:strand:+ start:171 stop:308 length:138 start_codon:yes stop_codon:yes gene_type:complete
MLAQLVILPSASAIINLPRIIVTVQNTSYIYIDILDIMGDGRTGR